MLRKANRKGDPSAELLRRLGAMHGLDEERAPDSSAQKRGGTTPVGGEVGGDSPQADGDSPCQNRSADNLRMSFVR